MPWKGVVEHGCSVRVFFILTYACELWLKREERHEYPG